MRAPESQIDFFSGRLRRPICETLKPDEHQKKSGFVVISFRKIYLYALIDPVSLAPERSLR
jgi:hypothetical protein